MWHRATDVRVDEIEWTRFSWGICEVCRGYMFVILEMLAEPMILEGEFHPLLV